MTSVCVHFFIFYFWFKWRFHSIMNESATLNPPPKKKKKTLHSSHSSLGCRNQSTLTGSPSLYSPSTLTRCPEPSSTAPVASQRQGSCSGDCTMLVSCIHERPIQAFLHLYLSNVLACILCEVANPLNTTVILCSTNTSRHKL